MCRTPLVKVADICWQPHEQRLVMALNRFDWVAATEPTARSPALPHGVAVRARQCCKCRNLDQADKDASLNLLAVEFAENDAPAGVVTLIFSGGGAIRLEVECLEAELVDLGPTWATADCPDHFAQTNWPNHACGCRGCCRRRREQLHQHDDRDQRRRIDDELHGGRLIDVADQRVQRAAEEARIAQDPRRVPHRLVERGDDVGLLQEGDRLRRHAGGKQRDQRAW